MSLYYDAASLFESGASREGSLKSRIFSDKYGRKSHPASIYALIAETAKHDQLLTEVIDNAGVLALEHKLTPILSLFLIHDLLLAKNGIAAPTNHRLRLAVERHKARLQAELTRSCLRRGCRSVEDLKKNTPKQKQFSGTTAVQPRWARANRLRSTVERQLGGTFTGYEGVDVLANVITAPTGKRLFHVDEHILDLLALPAGTDLSKTEAYKNGEIVLQDKASCFPAYLLLGNEPHDVGDVLDACAAPGNKTTHLASILSLHDEAGQVASTSRKRKLFACERDPQRSQTLQNMVKLSGAEEIVTILCKQDFLALNPLEARFQHVTHLLLDPSCSGSGIVGRNDMPVLALPQDPRAVTIASGDSRTASQKRKRGSSNTTEEKSSQKMAGTGPEDHEADAETVRNVDAQRLQRLANLQTRIIEHAFAFPASRRVTYSTCSVHIEENEAVVVRALASQAARQGGWRMLRKSEQPSGLRKWPHRGLRAKHEVGRSEQDGIVQAEVEDEVLQACIRCYPGTSDGTMGFFVCGFIKKAGGETEGSVGGRSKDKELLEEEWNGFSDDEPGVES